MPAAELEPMEHAEGPVIPVVLQKLPEGHRKAVGNMVPLAGQYWPAMHVKWTGAPAVV